MTRFRQGASARQEAQVEKIHFASLRLFVRRSFDEGGSGPCGVAEGGPSYGQLRRGHPAHAPQTGRRPASNNPEFTPPPTAIQPRPVAVSTSEYK